MEEFNLENKKKRDIENLKKDLGVDQEFAEKLLHIENLTMLAKEEGKQIQEGKLEKHESLLDTDLPASMDNTSFVLRNLLISLSKEELEIVKKYLREDFWFPSEHSAGSY